MAVFLWYFHDWSSADDAKAEPVQEFLGLTNGFKTAFDAFSNPNAVSMTICVFANQRRSATMAHPATGRSSFFRQKKSRCDQGSRLHCNDERTS